MAPCHQRTLYKNLYKNTPLDIDLKRHSFLNRTVNPETGNTISCPFTPTMGELFSAYALMISIVLVLAMCRICAGNADNSERFGLLLSSAY